jgi:hypothetical protein
LGKAKSGKHKAKSAGLFFNCFNLFAFSFQLKKMYLIKVKGVAKIPDYVQLRDDKFTLLAYFRVDRPEKSLDKAGLADKTEYIMNIVKELPFGQILKLDL